MTRMVSEAAQQGCRGGSKGVGTIPSVQYTWMPPVPWSQPCVQVTAVLWAGPKGGVEYQCLDPPPLLFPTPLQLELLCFPWEISPSLHSITAWRDLWGIRGMPGPSGATACGGWSTSMWRGFGGVGEAGMRKSFAILCSPTHLLGFALSHTQIFLAPALRSPLL